MIREILVAGLLYLLGNVGSCLESIRFFNCCLYILKFL
jgi:hypothetical protein